MCLTAPVALVQETPRLLGGDSQPLGEASGLGELRLEQRDGLRASRPAVLGNNYYYYYFFFLHRKLEF